MAQHPYDRQTAEMEYIRETEPPRTTGETPKSAPSADTVADFIAKFTAVGNNLISLLSGLLAAFLILYSGYVLYDTFSTQATARNSWDLLLTEIDESESTLAQAIAAVNDDYRCWLTVYDTKIDYPVLQGQDDLYYANHDIYGNTSLTGAIYLAANNSGDFSDTYNLIYGHHMADGIMFGALDSFETLNYFNSHRTGVIITKDRVYDLHFFAVLDTDAYESMVYNVGDRDLEALRAWLQDNAMIYDAQAAEGDKIVALSTCRDATTSGRLVIFATMTERVLLPMEVENYEAEYDAQSHSAADQIKVTLPEGTTVEYSVDGGQTWSQTPPAVENVMRDPQTQEVTALTVMLKAFHPDYGRAAETSFTMKVLPKAVTVTADPAGKIYGDADPEPFTATTAGTIGEDSVVIGTITRAEGEDVGTYPITPAGAAEQGNYTVTYVPGVFTISPKTGLELVVNGYDDVYDGQTHAASASCNDPEATVEYSIDGGETWSATPPSIKNVIRGADQSVGQITVNVRATKPNYVTATASTILRVAPKTVTVTANDSGKVFGGAEPTLTASVSGTIGSDSVDYTISRTAGENVGTYAITPSGDAEQGNYHVEYEPGTFTITRAPNGIALTATGYTGIYDGQRHTVSANAAAADGTPCTIEFSTDGGATWSTTVPGITDVIRNADNGVDGQTVLVRATNPNYDPSVITEVTLRVDPAPVVITGDNKIKDYGSADPALTATVSGALNGDVLSYSITRDPGELPGSYAIRPAGAAEQGNYSVTYVPGSLTISALTMNLTATGYSGVYDGVTHSVTASVNVSDAVIEYSVNGGAWTTTVPSRLNFGADTVRVRATRPGYTTVEKTVRLSIARRPVTVVVNDASKVAGTADPAFTYTVTGTIGNDTVAFTIGRAAGEAVGDYPITANGQSVQGNYIITYVPGTLSITAASGGSTNPPGPSSTPSPSNPPATPTPLPTQPPEPEEIVEEEPPLTQFVNGFRPTGGTHGDKAWALVNLICLLLTIYLFVPLLHLKDKYGRIKRMKALNEEKNALYDKPDLEEEERRERERILDTAVAMKNLDNVRAALADITGEDFANAVEELYYHVTVFARRFRLGFGLELVDVIAAIVAFVLTEDMRLPMVLIDKWTPLMLILLLICWVLDVRLMRYRDEVRAEEEAEEKEAQPV